MKDYSCKEPYINEKELISQLLAYLPNLDINEEYLLKKCKYEIERLHNLTNLINNHNEVKLTEHNTGTDELNLNINDKNKLKSYLIHVLKYGTSQERLEILKGIKTKFKLTNRVLWFD